MIDERGYSEIPKYLLDAMKFECPRFLQLVEEVDYVSLWDRQTYSDLVDSKVDIDELVARDMGLRGYFV